MNKPKGDRLYVLEVHDKQVKAHSHNFMRGWRMDQVLASRAFKYLIDDDPAIERMLRDASILAGKKRRTPDEEARYKELNAALRPILLSDGHTLYERTLELACIDEIRRRIKRIEPRLILARLDSQLNPEWSGDAKLSINRIGLLRKISQRGVNGNVIVVLGNRIANKVLKLDVFKQLKNAQPSNLGRGQRLRRILADVFHFCLEFSNGRS